MSVENKPAWVELSTKDPAGSRAFYEKLFGWKVHVDPDPKYGGYGMAQQGDKNVAGIGPKMQNDQGPTAWSIYIGTTDAGATAKKAAAAGGKVMLPPLDVPGQGTMSVVSDPSGAAIAVWQPQNMGGFNAYGENQFGWAELSARGLDKDVPFYKSIFGWSAKKSATGDGGPDYTEFQVGGESVAGAMEMNAMVPKEVPSYWMPYFNVGDVDAAFKKATGLGAREMVAPQDFPGGRFAIVSDPQGATFGLLKANPRT